MADSMTHPLTNALAMRTAARKEALGYAASDYSEECTVMANAIADDIAALPLEADHAALVAEAVKLPEIAALIEAVKETSAILQAAVVSGKVRGGDSYRIGGVYLQTVSDALDAADLSLQPFLALETP